MRDPVGTFFDLRKFLRAKGMRKCGGRDGEDVQEVYLLFNSELSAKAMSL